MLLTRHVTGDWGDLGEEDKKENELSVKKGFRILSAYTLKNGERAWIITEADRSVTTILLPSDSEFAQSLLLRFLSGQRH